MGKHLGTTLEVLDAQIGNVQIRRPWFNTGIQQLTHIQLNNPVLLRPLGIIHRTWR